MTIAARMAEPAPGLPTVPVPVASYVPVRRAGDLAFPSVQTPTPDGTSS